MTRIVLGATDGNDSVEAIKEQLRILCSYYLTTDEFGREIIMHSGETQSTKHASQLSRQLRIVPVPCSGLDAPAKLIDEVIERLPLALVRRAVNHQQK
jgi:hypothetical protein